jgi:hypothetical protein
MLIIFSTALCLTNGSLWSNLYANVAPLILFKIVKISWKVIYGNFHCSCIRVFLLCVLCFRETRTQQQRYCGNNIMYTYLFHPDVRRHNLQRERNFFYYKFFLGEWVSERRIEKCNLTWFLRFCRYINSISSNHDDDR